MSKHPALKPALAATLYLHRTEALRPAVAVLQADVQQMFAEQGNDVLWLLYKSDFSEASEDQRVRDERRAALILAALVAALERRLGRDAALLSPGLSRSLSIALMQASLSRYGIHASLASIKAQQWLAVHGAELVKGIDAFTRESLAGLLSRGVAKGLSVDEMARQMVLRFADMNYARAYRIAVTEASKAWSFAEMEGARIMEESGFRMLKEWLLGPLHPRYDLCDENAQVGGIPVDQPFPSGDMATPQHPHCGCGLVTYPDPGVAQPWGTNVLGQIPLVPWPKRDEVNNAAA